jgi:MYXO-CTERM domain-containing protein
VSGGKPSERSSSKMLTEELDAENLYVQVYKARWTATARIHLTVIRLRTLGALLVAVVSYAGEAAAGCGTTCVLTASPIAVEPPIACVDIKVQELDCQCSVELQFFNGCTTALDFSQAKLDGCYSDPQACNGIAPNSSNYKRVPAAADGHLHSSLIFSENGVEHTVTVDADVSNFRDVSCACRAPGSAPPPGRTGAYALTVAGLSFMGRRRRARLGQRDDALTASI